MRPVPIRLRLPRVLPLLFTLILVEFRSAPPARAFELWRHSAMSVEVLARQGLGSTTLGYIDHFASWPDVWGCSFYCYCPGWLPCPQGGPPTDQQILELLGPDHFDNSAIQASIDRVNQRMSHARTLLEGIPGGVWNDTNRLDYQVALQNFGSALHAIQDFYAHSNWLDCQTGLIRVSGDITNVPLFRGEDLACTLNIDGTVVSGLQTGYERVVPPAGSTTHEALNKDKPSSFRGSLEIRRAFPNVLIATYYEAVSGQIGGDGWPYTDEGLAPRHTLLAFDSLLNGTAVFDCCPLPKAATDADPQASAARRTHILTILAQAENDPGLQADVAEIQAIMAAIDPNDPEGFPLDLFDANGLPVDPTAVPAIPDGVRLLEQNVPNPFNPVTTIHFRATRPGPVRLAIYDAKGRAVRTLLDRSFERGSHSVQWDGRDDTGAPVPSGAYYYRLRLAEWQQTMRMVLVR